MSSARDPLEEGPQAQADPLKGALLVGDALALAADQVLRELEVGDGQLRTATAILLTHSRANWHEFREDLARSLGAPHDRGARDEA